MKIGIIGLGLIGGSLGRAIKKNVEDVELLGFDINAEAIKTAKLIQAVDKELCERDYNALDLLFIALYESATIEYLEKISPKLKSGAIVIDLCGNKRGVVEAMKTLAKQNPDVTFVGGHPMAGREFSGINHSTTNLFTGASMILVNVNSSLTRLSRLKEFFEKIGFGNVVFTTAEKHDEIIAFTSQLAHIVSSSYISGKTADEYLGFSAGSFRDMTRVARLSPDMWTELFLNNRDNLSSQIEELISHLTKFDQAIKNKDEKALYSLLSDGNERKLKIEKMKNKKNENN